MRQLRRAAEFEKYSLLARDGQIGQIEELYFDGEYWTVRYFVVRTGGWLLGRRVLIAPRVLTAIHEDSHQIGVELTRDEIEKSPPIGTEKPVSRHYEAEYHRYYGWLPYWQSKSFISPAPRRSPPADKPLVEPAHPRLRASSEVRGYSIQTHDGELGEVEDFIVDDGDWRIRYVVVSTRKWLPGKRVLVAPAWVSSIHWAGREMNVDLTRETIRSAPPYEPGQVIGHDYEVRLYGHYGKSLSESA